MKPHPLDVLLIVGIIFILSAGLMISLGPTRHNRTAAGSVVWQKVESSTGEPDMVIYRARIYGGWLVTGDFKNITFMYLNKPDEWTLNTIPTEDIK